MACRWIHFLNGEELRKVLSKCFEALKCGGKLCLTTESVHHGLFKEKLGRYMEEKTAGVEWPGMQETEELIRAMQSNLPGNFMFYDTDVIERELKRAGFDVEKVGCIDRRGVYPGNGCNDSREGIGAIAVKP